MIIKIHNLNYLHYVIGVVFVFALFYPVNFKDYGLLKTTMQLLLVLCILYALLWNSIVNRIFTVYDVACSAICMIMLISGLINPSVQFETIKMVLRIMNFWLFLKMTMLQNENKKRSLILGMSDYMVFICALSTILIIANGGQAYGHRFMLGSDNGIANIYFWGCCIAYYSWKYYRRNTFGLLLYVVIISSTLIYATLLEVGSAVLWVFIFIVFFVVTKVLGKSFLSIKRLLYIYGFFFSIVLLIISQVSFSNTVDILFYGKSNSVLARMKLWVYFLNMSKYKPFFGYGAGDDKYTVMAESMDKYRLVGNCHNVLVESLYHYGYITLFLIILLLITVIYIEKNKTIKDSLLGIYLFAFFMHGFLEDGMRYIFAYTTIIYYFYFSFEEHYIASSVMEEEENFE